MFGLAGGAGKLGAGNLKDGTAGDFSLIREEDEDDDKIGSLDGADRLLDGLQDKDAMEGVGEGLLEGMEGNADD